MNLLYFFISVCCASLDIDNIFPHIFHANLSIYLYIYIFKVGSDTVMDVLMESCNRGLAAETVKLVEAFHPFALVSCSDKRDT